VKIPPRIGPTNIAISTLIMFQNLGHTPKSPPSPPVQAALCLRGTLYARMVRPPESAPPTPVPAIALPMMNATLFGATAEIRDPSINIDMTVT